MNSYRKIIELWPTRAGFAEDLEIKQGTASAWWQRDSIPKEFWKPLVLIARKRGFKGVTYELLADIAAGSIPNSKIPKRPHRKGAVLRTQVNNI